MDRLPSSSRSDHRDFEDRGVALLTYVLNPLIVPPAALGILGAHATEESDAVLWIISTAIGMYVLLPGFMLYALKLSGRIRSFEIRDRRKRVVPMCAGVVISAVAIPVVSLNAGESSAVVAQVTVCFLFASLAATLITLRFKLSLHSAAYAGLLVVLMWISIFVPPATRALLTVGPVMVVISAALVVVVSWARLRSGAHSQVEVAAGILFGLVSISLSLYYSGSVLALAGISG